MVLSCHNIRFTDGFVLACISGDYNPALQRVVQADLVALLGLIIASVCWLLIKFNPQKSDAD
jgi:hypothetical protein